MLNGRQESKHNEKEFNMKWGISKCFLKYLSNVLLRICPFSFPRAFLKFLFIKLNGDFKEHQHNIILDSSDATKIRFKLCFLTHFRPKSNFLKFNPAIYPI